MLEKCMLKYGDYGSIGHGFVIFSLFFDFRFDHHFYTPLFFLLVVIKYLLLKMWKGIRFQIRCGMEWDMFRGGGGHVSHPTVSTLLIIFCSEGRDRLWLRHHAWDEVVDMDVQVQ